MSANRSSEEMAMREVIVAWGRTRWPDARVVHELVTGQCRIDLAFVRPADLIGIEIKSSKDTLSRLEKQMAEFKATLPEVWLAFHPHWVDELRRNHFEGAWQGNRLQVDPDNEPPMPNVMETWGRRADRNWRVYPNLLELLWAGEAACIAARKGVAHHKRTPRYKLLPELARMLTGQEIIEQVCRELRGRNAFAEGSDAPIREAAA